MRSVAAAVREKLAALFPDYSAILNIRSGSGNIGSLGYCRDCILKHFLHTTGLAEEAQMLAGAHASKAPLHTGVTPAFKS